MKTTQREVSELRIALLLACVAVLLCPIPSIANDSAASTAAGGLVLRHEPNVSMKKERLFLSMKKVTVDYEFVNESDRDVTTEVAFPIPPYTFAFDDPGGPRGFDDFRLFVDNQATRYEISLRAMAKGVDKANLLLAMGIDIDSFAKFDYTAKNEEEASQISALSKIDQQKLIAEGLVDPDTLFPAWTIEKTYHWTQRFPAHKLVRVRHEYQPVVGFIPIQSTDLDPAVRQKKVRDEQEAAKKDAKREMWFARISQLIDNSCVEPALQGRIAVEATREYGTRDPAQQGDVVSSVWLDYILTTANSWKGPIHDFELEVERPPAEQALKWYVSFCWNGKVEHPDADHFRVSVKDFVPTKELHVAFFYVSPSPKRVN